MGFNIKMISILNIKKNRAFFNNKNCLILNIKNAFFSYVGLLLSCNVSLNILNIVNQIQMS